MITEWFIDIALTVVAWMIGLLPDADPMSETSPGGMIQQLLDIGGVFVPWVNWGYVVIVLSVPLAVWVIGVAWKGARMLFSHIPAIGGSG